MLAIATQAGNRLRLRCRVLALGGEPMVRGPCAYALLVSLAGCVVPEISVKVADAGSDVHAVVPAGQGPDGATDDGGPDSGGGGSGGDLASAARGGKPAPPVLGLGGRQAGGRGGVGGKHPLPGGMDAGETTPGGRDGSTGNGDSSGSGGGGESGATGGSGGSGGSAGSSGAGSAGSGNGCVPAWRTQSSTDSFDDLGLPPGNEDNTQWVYQYICRGTPAGQTALLLGKGVPGFGCYGTYAEGTTRHGFGIENDFEVLVPSASCATTWQPVTAGVIPLELGKVPGLYACRGVLTNEPYPGGVASGLELGQWVPAAGGGDFECWTQFHDDGQKDHGSKRVEREVEVLVHAP